MILDKRQRNNSFIFQAIIIIVFGVLGYSSVAQQVENIELNEPSKIQTTEVADSDEEDETEVIPEPEPEPVKKKVTKKVVKKAMA